MSYRWVQQAVIRPHHCAAVPFIGNANNAKGFFDTGTDMPGFDNHVYISVEWVEGAARAMDWHPQHVLDGLHRDMAQMGERLAAYEAEVADLNARLEAVHILRREPAGHYSESRKPGRKPKEEVPA